MHTKNQKGFAIVLCLALLPCLIAGLLFVFVLINFMKNDLGLKHQCRIQGEAGQKSVKPLLIQLLSLNPKAQLLKSEYLQAKTAQKLAIAAKNVPEIQRLEIVIQKIQLQRHTLDKQQKRILSQANLLLYRNHSTTALGLRRMGASNSTVLLTSTLQQIHGRAPDLAVLPESPDIAPIYKLKPDFENQQSLAHEWQYRITVRPPFSNFIKGDFSFKKACAVTLVKDGSTWIPKIIKGKFSLKSVW